MIFYKLDYDCDNCGSDVWHKDLTVELRTRGHRTRYSCLYCGADIWPGGATRPTLVEEKSKENKNRKEFDVWLNQQEVAVNEQRI